MLDDILFELKLHKLCALNVFAARLVLENAVGYAAMLMVRRTNTVLHRSVRIDRLGDLD